MKVHSYNCGAFTSEYKVMLWVHNENHRLYVLVMLLIIG